MRDASVAHIAGVVTVIASRFQFSIEDVEVRADLAHQRDEISISLDEVGPGGPFQGRQRSSQRRPGPFLRSLGPEQTRQRVPAGGLLHDQIGEKCDRLAGVDHDRASGYGDVGLAEEIDFEHGTKTWVERCRKGSCTVTTM